MNTLLAAGGGEDKPVIWLLSPPRLPQTTVDYRPHKNIEAGLGQASGCAAIMDLHPSSSNRANRLVATSNPESQKMVYFLFQDEAILKDSSPNSLCQNFSKFATTTSAHGFAYTVDGPILRRIVSVVIVVAFVAVAGNFTYFAIRF